MRNIITVIILLAFAGCESTDDPCIPSFEWCNGIDDDCDGLVDEDNVCCHPSAEVCNSIDDDCDGLVDEDGVCATLTPDGTYGVTLTVTASTCTTPVGTTYASVWEVTTSGSTLYRNIDGTGAVAADEYDPVTYNATFTSITNITDPAYPGYVAVQTEVNTLGFIVTSSTDKDLICAITFNERVYAEGDIGGAILAECVMQAQAVGPLMY